MAPCERAVNTSRTSPPTTGQSRCAYPTAKRFRSTSLDFSCAPRQRLLPPIAAELQASARYCRGKSACLLQIIVSQSPAAVASTQAESPGSLRRLPVPRRRESSYRNSLQPPIKNSSSRCPAGARCVTTPICQSPSILGPAGPAGRRKRTQTGRHDYAGSGQVLAQIREEIPIRLV